VGASLLAVLVVSVLLAAVARRYDVSAPLALVVAGLAGSLIPGFKQIELDPRLVLYVLLPPLLWSAGLESSYHALRRNIRPIGLLAVGLPLATTFAVGWVAYKTVPELTVAAALTLGAIVAPPDAVSATAIGRRLGLPRRVMTLLGGESLLNDATALTAYKVSLAAAIGTAATWGSGLATLALAAAGGVAVGVALGAIISWIRWRLDDPLVESALGLVAPFIIYLTAEEIHGSGVLAVVVAALILGQKSTRASYATRLHAWGGVAGRGVRCSDDDDVRCAVSGTPTSGVPDVRRRDRHAAAARADAAVADPATRRTRRRGAHRRARRGGRAGQGGAGGGRPARRTARCSGNHRRA
jgi:NhaP-type Na+/H+ or K+/H+ antiporter